LPLPPFLPLPPPVFGDAGEAAASVGLDDDGAAAAAAVVAAVGGALVVVVAGAPNDLGTTREYGRLKSNARFKVTPKPERDGKSIQLLYHSFMSLILIITMQVTKLKGERRAIRHTRL
jgi:hypothetical protein